MKYLIFTIGSRRLDQPKEQKRTPRIPWRRMLWAKARQAGDGRLQERCDEIGRLSVSECVSV